jgi:hypothetical protein
MKAMRIAVVAGVLVGLVAATVQAGLFNANVTGKITGLRSGVIATASFSSRNLLAASTTNRTSKLVVDSSSGALQVVDGCGNVITNILTIVGTSLTIGPDSKSNEVDAVLVSFGGTGATNGSAVVTTSNGRTFKASETFQFELDGDIFAGKITTSSAFKPAHGCDE